ncbi:MAG: DNA mismatch repair endonuclease MutL [Candidatus Spyradosoma sp.]
MPKIRILSDNVANQIAAGEVVERPMSVVKELLENAIDAGATRIHVEFRNGGRSFISIEDNGCGMTRDEALTALERHATSKIRETEDLDTIRTFGFRGEALPSIASVSRFTLRTKTEEDALGTEIFVNGGRYVHCRDVGMAAGTKIEVTGLFSNVPARLKFLKSENTEAAHITRAIRLYAVAHPKIAFTLWEDGREIFRSPANLEMLDRVAAIWGRQLADDLMPLEPAEGFGMRLTGLLGKPGVSRSSRQEMVTVVNGRPVDNRTMAYSLVESYHTLIPRGRYPLAFLFLEIDPHAVDVNVHPAKREIRFRDESRVRNFLITTVLKTIAPETFAAPAGAPVPARNFRAETARGASPDPAAAPEAFPERAELPETRREPASPHGGADASEPPERRADAPETDAGTPTPAPRPVPAEPRAPARAAVPAFDRWRFFGKLAGEPFALFQADDGLLLLHLRFARERVWFERVLARFREETPVSQPLLIPEPMEFEPLLADALSRHLRTLAAAGFDLEIFGRDFFRLNAVPDWLPKDADARAFVRDLVARIARLPADFSRADVAAETLARIAATQAAATASENFDETKIRLLLRELFACAQPNVSPDGRKIFIEIPKREILRRFG